jgi:hypothetical protein
MLGDFYARDRHLLTHAAEFEAAFGDKRDPGPEYAEAKERAVRMMEELKA